LRREKQRAQVHDPVLVLDDGDYTNGTAFGAATRETGAKLQLLFLMGYDATTFGNHRLVRWIRRFISTKIICKCQAQCFNYFSES
jgi:hypothetical protein